MYSIMGKRCGCNVKKTRYNGTVEYLREEETDGGTGMDH